VLILAADDLRGQTRLARDILAAAGLPDADGGVREHAFVWPLPGTSGGDPGRALAAFADKRMADAGARVVLLPDSVAALLADQLQGSLAAAVVPLPALSRLVTEPEQKRELWHRILQKTR
jgi:hypothetical protein